MKSKSLCIFISCTIIGCLPKSIILKSSGGGQEAIYNAIIDFNATSSLSDNDSTFSVYLYDVNEDIIGVSIYGTSNKLLISTEDHINYDYKGLPNQYLELDGSLFYWDDPNHQLNEEAINIYMKYGLLDTTVMNVYIPSMGVDHSKKSHDYYFCKKDLLKYKKVKTRIAFGDYEPPKLQCK